MKEFIKKIVENLNTTMDNTPIATGKSPKEYRNLGEKHSKNRLEHNEDEENER